MKFRKATVWAGALGATAIGVLLTSGGCSSTTTTSSSPDSGSDGSTTTSSSSGGSSTTSSSGGSSTSSSSGSSGGDDGSAGDGSTSDGSSSGGDGATDGSSSGNAGDSGCSGATPIELAIYNYKAWCDVSVAGTAITTPTIGTTEKQTVCVAAGVDLSATAVTAAFEIGTPPLPFLSGANTVTDDGTTAKTTLKTDSTCVFICCPFLGGTGCTETDGGALANPCP